MRTLIIISLLSVPPVLRAQADCDSLVRAQQVQLEELVAKVRRAQYDLDRTRREAEVLRQVMKGYIVTIDSLSRSNARLREELDSR